MLAKCFLYRAGIGLALAGVWACGADKPGVRFTDESAEVSVRKHDAVSSRNTSGQDATADEAASSPGPTQGTKTTQEAEPLPGEERVADQAVVIAGSYLTCTLADAEASVVACQLLAEGNMGDYEVSAAIIEGGEKHELSTMPDGEQAARETNTQARWVYFDFQMANEPATSPGRALVITVVLKDQREEFQVATDQIIKYKQAKLSKRHSDREDKNAGTRGDSAPGERRLRPR